ncbi:ABC-F family ATP-binding cassette domain-containing protein [Dietzia cinnamea]|uniref:ABC-F family ATP-binding cassette domain-containing protein n=3 Tax=Dietzia TaxID=37914 RepID=A0AAW5Q342_9ACTN|nr:ABC-F family ATP-binding cassette domain-containing protein [Dietzia cinnamea]PWD95804.1 glycerophosphodiester phosphodiesterase [Dietzia maris]MBM7229644.1 ABC-F family ATP-binding cassette domain-containing protein [Dietzia cinnamea]MCT1863653.1 ABC-F family ATP-binding cassette domain-containing protein [Dietzia cinnamea]MCT2029039.1 ABC-F family ATP-binding cassette domain-containing protein [Dietzia cinnamea]MCT2033131.1 ABC-F family ATP-binding cassette domain-containing protein [Diet
MAPTNLINLEQGSISFGIRQVLDNVSLGVNAGDRIGVVGLNGGGKTTLLEILTGVAEPDTGRVSRVSGLRMAVVTQRTELAADTVGEAVVGGLGLAVHEWAGDARVRAVLDGIGIHDLGLDTPVADLSGGERRRVSLAAALVQDLDLLVLDEPTNHLDVEDVQWLADHLVGRSSALVVVTHDRWFLDTVATRTWEVVDGRVEQYEGGYNDWVFARAERDRQAAATESRRQNLMRKELAWLRRGAPARTSKPRYRIEAAEALIKDVPPPRDSLQLSSFAARRLGKVVVELEDARLDAPDGRTLVDDLTWRLAPGERIGLVGVNGSGKTTLLRALAGAAPLAAGRRKEGKTVRIGWLKQELDDLPLDQRVLEAIEDVATRVAFGKDELTASQLAERLGFSPARQRTPVGDLSGGERRRLQLTRVLMDEPNVLLLDEPTNDLDIDTLRQLEDLLDGWPGTMVVISHDRYLVERICDSVWALFGDGRLTNLPRGIDEYLERRRAAGAAGDSGKVSRGPVGGASAGAAGSGGAAAGAGGAGAAGGSAGSGGAAGAAGRTAGGVAGAGGAGSGLSSAEERALTKEMSKIERQMGKLDSREAELHREMAAVSEGAMGTEKLAALDRDLKDVSAEKDALEERWMELGEQLEG